MISQIEYARHRGVTRSAVCQAIRQGRLRESVVLVRQGKREIRKISSAAAADAEWDANTTYHHPDISEVSPKEAKAARLQADADAPLRTASPTEVRKRLDIERLTRLRLQNEAAEREALLAKGEMVLASTVRADIGQLFSVVRLNLRQVPTRMGQQFPSLDRAVLHAMLDEIDSALTTLADME